MLDSKDLIALWIKAGRPQPFVAWKKEYLGRFGELDYPKEVEPIKFNKLLSESRTLVSCKLPRSTYVKLMAFCGRENITKNKGLIWVLSDYFSDRSYD